MTGVVDTTQPGMNEIHVALTHRDSGLRYAATVEKWCDTTHESPERFANYLLELRSEAR